VRSVLTVCPVNDGEEEESIMGRLFGRSSEDARLVLGFDAGCMTCSELAKSIEDAVGERLEVRSLHDPQVHRWREEALGEDALWAPTLIEVRGEEVRAWTGMRMGVRLSRALGPKDTWRVMQVLGEMRSGDPAAQAPATAGDRGLSRAQFLKGLGGAAVAMSLFSAGGNIPSTAGAATQSSTQTGGTQEQRLRAWRIAVNSERFRRLNREQVRLAGKGFRYGFNDSWVRVRGNYALVSIISEYDDESQRGVTAVFYVALGESRLVASSQVVVAGNNNGEYYVSWGSDDTISDSATVGEDYVLTSEGERISHQQWLNRIERVHGDRASEREFRAQQGEDPCFGFSLCFCCSAVVSVLGCVPFCAAVTAVTGPGGAICAAGCSLGSAALCDQAC
jgi:hypothetical protein